MNSLQYFVIGGVALGAVQFTTGMAIGLWVGRKQRHEGNPQPLANSLTTDHERAARLAADLGGLTATIASSVRRHHAALESIDQRLRVEMETDASAESPEQLNLPLTNLVVGVVAEMLAANQSLQKELGHAESQLALQSSELVEHQRHALTDSLTGLPNRRALDDHLQSRLEAWRKVHEPFTLLMLDIDHFKPFNDTHGHQAGDHALQAFATAVASSLRKGDVVARYGGEEFMALLPHTTLNEAGPAIAKIRSAIAKLRVEAGGELAPLTASCGVASILPYESGERLISRADEALYAAKENGRDRAYLHDGADVRALGAADEAPASFVEGLSEACDDLREGLESLMAKPSHPAPLR